MSIDILNLLRGHILALRQLEDVLLPIDDDELPLRRPQANVTAHQPSLLVDGLPRLLLVLVVSHKDVRSTDPDLAPTPAGFAQMRRIGVKVSHLGNVRQNNLAGIDGTADVPDRRYVVGMADGGAGRPLRLAVSLHHGNAEHAPEEDHDALRERGRSAHHEAQMVQSQGLLDFVEDQSIV